jgi:ribonuclease J
MFPDAEMMGVDVVIPDLTYLRGLGAKFKGIFLTHGHEDHIGALPYVLPDMSVPVWGSPLTLGFVDDRLGQHELDGDLRRYGMRPSRAAHSRSSRSR